MECSDTSLHPYRKSAVETAHSKFKTQSRLMELLTIRPDCHKTTEQSLLMRTTTYRMILPSAHVIMVEGFRRLPTRPGNTHTLLPNNRRHWA